MNAAQAFAFLLFAFIAAVTPGPSNAMILATGAIMGPWRGISCPVGAALGMGTMIVLSALGIGKIVAAAPAIVLLMKGAGSLFLLWLAWKILNAGTFDAGRQTGAAGFLQAFLFQWLNPKGWLVALSAGSTYWVPARPGALGNALSMGLLFAISALLAGLIWLGMGAAVSRHLRHARAARIFNIMMASALTASIALVWK